MATNPQMAQQLARYSPAVQQQFRRSQYLTDALEALSAPQENIRSPWELAARLAGVAIARRGASKAQDRTAALLKSEKDARMARLLAGLPQLDAQPAPVPQMGPALAPQPQAAPVPPPQAAPATPSPVPPQPAPTPAVNFTPQDRDGLIRMLATEAIGEGPDGMAAAGHVALNRLKSGKFGKSLRDVVYAPNQFEGMSRANQVGPQEYEQAAQVADAILAGQMPDPAGGALNFLNPDLQAQMGRDIPSWAQGPGQRIGRHVFFGGNPQAMQMAEASQPPADDAFTFQLMTAGAGANPFPPPAPASSPAEAAAPPAAPPQAAAGGNPTTYQPTREEVAYVTQLLRSGDPTQEALGEELALKLRYKMTQPVELKPITVNGLPALQNPYTGEIQMSEMPAGARTQTRQDVPGLTPGTVAQVKPTGDMSILQAPPSGFQGSPQQQTYIRGGPQDPAAGANLVANESKLRDDYAKEVQPYIIAREGLNKVIQAAKTGNPAGDIALVFGYMKTLDPGSTVREGEQAQVANSGTIPQTVTNIYNKLLTGAGSLSPAQRAQFADSAYRQFQVYQQTFDAANERYGGLAKSYGFDPGRIVRQFDRIEPFAPPQAPGQAPVSYPAPVAKAHQNMVARGQYDPKAPLGSERRPFLATDEASIQAVDRPENKGKFIILPNGDTARID